MVSFTKETSSQIKGTVLVFIITEMEITTMENGQMTVELAVVVYIKQMAVS
jgi:hypothetical protein